MICCCSLAGTKACLNCPNYLNDIAQINSIPFPLRTSPLKRIIKEYDGKGNLIKEIIEE
jgi:hypothetical protein